MDGQVVDGWTGGGCESSLKDIFPSANDHNSHYFVQCKMVVTVGIQNMITRLLVSGIHSRSQIVS